MAKLRSEECPGVGHALASVLEDCQHFGHHLAGYVCMQQAGIICTTCGAHANVKVDLLGSACKRPTKKGQQCLKRFQVGLRPCPRKGQQLLDTTWTVPRALADGDDDEA